MSKPRLIVVEGADGLGKSSLSAKLACKYGVNVTRAPSSDNSVGFLRNVVKSPGLEPFERQCLVALSIIVDFYEKIEMADLSTVVMDRCHLSTTVYGLTDKAPKEKMIHLAQAMNSVAGRWSKGFDIDLIILDRAQRFGKADGSYQEQNLSWENIRKTYRYFAEDKDRGRLFGDHEKVHLLEVDDKTQNEVFEEAVRILG